MKCQFRMCVIRYLALWLAVSTYSCDGISDEEYNAAFQNVKEVLQGLGDIDTLLSDVKGAVNSNTEYKIHVYGLLKALPVVVPNLKNNIGYNVARGASILASYVGADILTDHALQPVRTLIAKVIRIIDSDRTGKIIDSATKVLQKINERDLKIEIDKFKKKIDVFMQAVRSGRSDDITEWVNQPFNFGAVELLKRRIYEYRISHDPEVAKRSFDLSIMYAQLATLKDLALAEGICLLNKEQPLLSKLFTNIRNTIIEGSRDDMSFWNNPQVEHAGALVYYYPLGSSLKGKFLRGFLYRLNVAEPQPWSLESCVLMSIQWPTTHLYFHLGRGNKLFLAHSSIPPMSKDKMIFQKMKDGYFKLKSTIGEDGKERRVAAYLYAGLDEWADKRTFGAFYEDITSYLVGEDGQHGEEENYHFIVISYPGTDIITISSKNLPHKFVGGAPQSYSVRLQEGNIGRGILFYTNPCLKGAADKISYKCPEYTPKLE